MSAKFKSAIKKSTYNKGLRIFTKLLVTPAIKLGSAAVKDVITMGNNHTSMNNGGSIKPDKAISYNREQREEMDTLQKIHIRDLGIEQCKITSSILDRLFKEDGISLDLSNALLKTSVAINRYLDKNPLCGIDFYSFATVFISSQISTVKKEKTKWEYKVVQELLFLIRTAKPYDTIVESIREFQQ